MVIPSPGNVLFVGSLTVLSTRLGLFFQFVMKVVQFTYRVGPADLSIFLFAQPGESLFEQVQHPLDKCLVWAILLSHKIPSIGCEIEWEGPQPKRLSCTAAPVSVDHGEDFLRTFAPAEGSTR